MNIDAFDFYLPKKLIAQKSLNPPDKSKLLYISDEEIRNRKEKWKQPDLKIKKGILYKYLKSVSNASNGCVTDE